MRWLLPTAAVGERLGVVLDTWPDTTLRKLKVNRVSGK
ncbi:hypothetical protein NORO109296_11540 [Nocardiopsis rhodophaea]